MQPTQQDQASMATWPGAFGVFKYSQKLVTANLGVVLIYFVVAGGFTLAFNVIGRSAHTNLGIQFVSFLISLLVDAFIAAFSTVMFLTIAQGKHVDFGWALGRAGQIYLRVIIIHILFVAATFAGLILFIIPALVFIFYFLPRLALTLYFIADEHKNMQVFDAISASWKITDGNVGKVWGIIGATLLFILPIITVIGALLTLYLVVMYSAAVGLLYVYLAQKHVVQPSASAWTPPTAPVPQPPMPPQA